MSSAPSSPHPAGTVPAPHFRREPAVSNHVESAAPVAGRRLSGPHWWDVDRLAHLRDAPSFCPACAAGLEDAGSIAVEFWEGERRVFHTRCGSCGWSGDIARVERMVGHEAPH